MITDINCIVLDYLGKLYVDGKDINKFVLKYIKHIWVKGYVEKKYESRIIKYKGEHFKNLVNLRGLYCENTKITDYGIGASSPIFSPDGRYIAFIHYIFNENMDYIASTQIEVFEIETGETKVAASGSGIISLAGWVVDE